MTWKSTAVVSGAGLLATWLASYPPAGSPAVVQVAAPAAIAVGATDIVQQADRLQTRVREVVEYQQSVRDPFRFSHRAAGRVTPAGAVATPPPPVAAVPPAPAIRLAGIAIDTVDGREQRTAILTTPAGLVFAHEGEEVDGVRVVTIRDDSVDLRRGAVEITIR